MADPRIEFPHSITTGSAEDVSYHLVPFPVEVGFASISCSNTAGMIRLTYVAAGEPTTLTFLPHSPIYNIQNASCAGNAVVPLGRADGKPQVAVLTFDNNRKPAVSSDAGEICVMVALSLPAANKQEKVLVKRKLEPGQATTVHVVFSPA